MLQMVKNVRFEKSNWCETCKQWKILLKMDIKIKLFFATTKKRTMILGPIRKNKIGLAFNKPVYNSICIMIMLKR